MSPQLININTFARFLFYLCCFLVLTSIERVIGLPLFTFMCVGIWLSSLPTFTKLPALIIISFIISVFYLIPMTVVVLLLFVTHMNLEVSEKIVVDQSIRFFFTILFACGVVGVLSHAHFGWVAWTYHFFAAVGLLIFIRYWLYRKNATHILRISQRLRTK